MLFREWDTFLEPGSAADRRSPRRFRAAIVCGLALLVTLSMAVVVLPRARATYGTANWQAAFSGNFNIPGVGVFGFWGWCAFGGSADGGLTGNSADCVATSYVFPVGGNDILVQMDVNGVAWDMEPTSFPAPTLPADDFFITAGTVSLAGPTIVQALMSGGPVPPGCVATGSTVTCPISGLEAVGLYSPDTGVPAAAGHFSLREVFEFLGIPVPPGTQVNVQVTRVS